MSFDIGISGQYFYLVRISSHPSFAKTQMTPKELFFIGFKRSCLLHNPVSPMFSWSKASNLNGQMGVRQIGWQKSGKRLKQEVNSGRKPSPRHEDIFLSIEKTVGAWNGVRRHNTGVAQQGLKSSTTSNQFVGIHVLSPLFLIFISSRVHCKQY